MSVIKDLMLCALFLCMFGVLLVFLDLNNDLRSNMLQGTVTVNAQVKVIEAKMIGIKKRDFKIEQLQIEIIDLKEMFLILQKRYETKKEKIVELIKENKQLKYFIKSNAKTISKLKKENKELKDKYNKELNKIQLHPHPGAPQ